MPERPERKHPAEGVFIFRGQATIVFLTVCTQKRGTKLANSLVQQVLVASWQQADAWRVGHYLIMPDHIHLFCSPQNEDYTIEQWITFWKRQFRRSCGENGRDFNHADFITAFAATTATPKSGNTFARIPFVRVSSKIPTIGRTKDR
jgi:REP element-mobilizing transposase RayT